MINIVKNIITTEFDNSIGRNQFKKDTKTGMQVSFSLTTECEKEDGYRNLDILIFAPMNYVAVLVRERWDVISLKDIGYNENSESHIKPDSNGYIHGATKWLCAGYHDSCWRDSVGRVLKDNVDRIITINNITEWYKRIELSIKEIEELSKVWIDYEEENRYVRLKGVFQF